MDVSPENLTVGLVFHNEKNEEMIQDLLSKDHSITTTLDSSARLDLLLLDTASYQKRTDEIRTLDQRERELFFPVVILAKKPDDGLLDQEVVNDVLEMPVKKKILRNRIQNFLNQRRLTMDLYETNQTLEEKVEKKTEEIRQREQEVLSRLATASKFRDEETGAHIRRLGEYAQAMAQQLRWDPSRMTNLKMAAVMHDVGKIGIPDHILQKPGDLTDDEYKTMQNHTVIGGQIFSGTHIDMFQMARNVALTHHEKWDGSGYPEELSGEEIPESGRIVAILDVYDALVHDRVYRDAFTESEALNIMRDDAGEHFDPDLFEVFEETLPRIREIRRENPDDESLQEESEFDEAV